jgi:hypothetical protein
MKLTRVLAGFASVALLVASLVALLPDRAYACSCASFGGSPEQRAERVLDKSAAVFTGKVVDLERNFKQSMYGSLNKVSFRVTEVWKGPKRETLELTTPSQEMACGYSFSEGRTYLVDATGKKSLDTSICSETKPLSEASKTVQALSLVDTSGGVSVLGVFGLAGLTGTIAGLVLLRLLLRRSLNI